MGRVAPVGWALVEVVQALENVFFQWNNVVVEFHIFGSHLDAHFLRDTEVQKRSFSGTVELAALQTVYCRYRRHRTDALEPEDGGESASAINDKQ